MQLRAAIQQQGSTRTGAVCAALLLALALPPQLSAGEHPPAEPPQEVREQLLAGVSQDLLVLFADARVEAEATTIRQERRLRHDDAALVLLKARRYDTMKTDALNRLPAGQFTIRKTFAQLPMVFIRIATPAALEKLLADPSVVAVYENKRLYWQLTQSLPLIKQSQAASLGLTGSNTSVAVIDTGVNYGLTAFGSCTAPGIPAGCRVAASVDIAPDDGSRDDNGHGTNVSAIIAGTATGAKLVALDVFDDDSATFADVIDAINWAIEHKTTYGIVALNMSLGDGERYTSPCSSKATNPFVTPIANARAVGIVPVAAAGNEAYSTGISLPACTPGVVSVGAVYDANVGARTWSGCSDTTTAADKVTCFSNSAGFMTMLAPGALISAGGYTMGGTSQAAPHVAGAAATLRAAFPGETLDQTVARLTTTGTAVTDPRNGIVKPRLNLLAAFGPPTNDMFTAAQTLAGTSGTLAATSHNATREAAEPLHAGVNGTASIWWQWVPSVSGMASLNTHGSGFDTLLAVYTGTALSGLTPVAANNDDSTTGGTSSLSFLAQAGVVYRIAVDGVNGAAGAVTLSWDLTPAADLTVGLAMTPAAVLVGDTSTATLTTVNQGPSSATQCSTVLTLPDKLAFVSASAGCTLNGNLVNCNLGTMAAGAMVETTVIVRSEAHGIFSVTAQAASATNDPVTDNNTTEDAITATEPPPAVPALSPWGIAGLITLLGSCLRKPSPTRH
jgi:subtilisin family serine protease